MSKPTTAQRRRWNKIVEYGCIICSGPAQIHHIRHGQGMGQRDHDKVIPLCHFHHTARHLGPEEFIFEYGPEETLLLKIKELLGEL